MDIEDLNLHHEDPVPFIVRHTGTTGLFRFVACRPLDGIARTDATFWRAGEKSFTRSKRLAAFEFWPGWKRGLLVTRLPGFVLLPWTAVSALHDVSGVSALPVLSLSVSGSADILYASTVSYLTWRHFSDRRFQRNYVVPLERIAASIVRTRLGVSAKVSKGVVSGKDDDARAFLYLPREVMPAEGDKARLLEAVRAKLDNEGLDALWNLSGASPHVEFWTPPQPPARVQFEPAREKIHAAPEETPWLGTSATGGDVEWDLRMESPHIAVVGGSGSGKSEIIAAIVSHFMRRGAGVVVLDPKFVSHMWMRKIPGVCYASEGEHMTNVIMWLDEELKSRARGIANGSIDADSLEKILVVLEERNSAQDVLQDYWLEIKAKSDPAMAPARKALDRLGAMGREMGIHVLLAAQDAGIPSIGKRTNFGAAILAGRTPANQYRFFGVKQKPAIKISPGRFCYVYGDSLTPFQAPLMDIKKHPKRLIEFATERGVFNVNDLMTSTQAPQDPWSERSESMSSSEPTVHLVTLRDFCKVRGLKITDLQNWRGRDAGFPEEVDRRGNASLYHEIDLEKYVILRKSDSDSVL